MFWKTVRRHWLIDWLIDWWFHSFIFNTNALIVCTCAVFIWEGIQKPNYKTWVIPERFRTLIIDDIFRKQQGSHYNGLIDATSDLTYDKIFASLIRKWQELEVSAASLKRFVDWFCKYKSYDIKRSMLKPVREKAELGRPPVLFTTNASESMHALMHACSIEMEGQI